MCGRCAEHPVTLVPFAAGACHRADSALVMQSILPRRSGRSCGSRLTRRCFWLSSMNLVQTIVLVSFPRELQARSVTSTGCSRARSSVVHA
jgi:hypothetical protein